MINTSRDGIGGIINTIIMCATILGMVLGMAYFITSCRVEIDRTDLQKMEMQFKIDSLTTK